MNGLHQRQERHVEAQHLVFGMVRDPGDLVRVQPRVDGVQHTPRAARAKVDFQVTVAVPGERRHPVGEQQVHAIERVGDLARALGDVTPGVAVDVALHSPGHYLGVAVVALGVVDQRRNQQRLVLHQAEHRDSS
jgi:hypothetical protein